MFNIKRYLKDIKEANKGNTYKISLLNAWKYYYTWRKYWKADMGPMDSEIPWINFPAIDYLKNIAHSEMKVFEYGSGGSTLFWARRVQEVYSIEHDKEWAKNVTETIVEKHIQNVVCYYIEPEIDNLYSIKNTEEPNDFISDDERYSGSNFEKYVKKINDFPDDFFDIVVVDGRARPSCIFYSLQKIKTGGYLVLDNSDRSYYLNKNLSLLEAKWIRQDFNGPVPSLDHFCMTTIFKKTV